MREAFNQMMLNLMGSMKTDFQLTPHRTPSVISAAGGGAVGIAGMRGGVVAGSAPSALICYNCQRPGHYASQCKSTSTRNTDNRGARESTTTSGSLTVKPTGTGESAGNMQTSRGTTGTAVVSEIGRVTEVVDEQLSFVSCGKIVSVAADENKVEVACFTLMRMPAVAVIFEKEIVDKRVRVAFAPGHRGPRILRGPTRNPRPPAHAPFRGPAFYGAPPGAPSVFRRLFADRGFFLWF